MSGPSDDFGMPAISKKELRSVFLVLSTAVVLLLLFGVGLAIRLRSTTEALSEGRDGPPVAEAPAEPRVTPVVDSVIEEISTARAVLPTVDGAATPRYGVRVGIFGQPENADRMLLRLQAEGYAPFAVIQRLGGQTLRYVYAAATASEADAASLAATIQGALDLDTYVELVAPEG